MALLERIIAHPGMAAQVQEWRDKGVVDDEFEPEDILFTPDPSEHHTPNVSAPRMIRDGGLRSGPYYLPYNPSLVERAREFRKNMTPAEKKLWYEFLRGFHYPVLRQRPIDQYIVDFYSAQLKLVIEIDGDSHYTEYGKAYDEQRTRVLEGYGLRVMRFTNTQVLRDFEAVCEEIESPLNPSLGRGEGRDIAEPRASYQTGNGSTPPVESSLSPPLGRGEAGSSISEPPLERGAGGIHPRYQYLPLDTKYFPDLELDILALFSDPSTDFGQDQLR